METRSQFDATRLVNVDPFARNPLADDWKQLHPTFTNAGPPPTLFPGGDLPRATASGNPPTMLLDLPWIVRHYAAKADQREFARLLNEVGRGVPDADALAMFEPGSRDEGNDAYRDRVSRWASTPTGR